jgi:hypothetical protein
LFHIRGTDLAVFLLFYHQMRGMYRLGFVLLAVIFCGSCKSKTGAGAESGFVYEDFANLFPPAKLPYSISDTALLRNTDTTQIRSAEFAKFIPDSIRNRIFPKKTRVRYSALSKIEVPKAETYFIVKAIGAPKRAALLVAFDKDGNYAGTFPFLVPDADPTTLQSSSIDKTFSISRNIVRRKNSEVLGEGKDVFIFSADIKKFVLIGTDLLDEKNVALINPIDTLPKTRRFAGDYVLGKRNLISIRDGKTPDQAMAFIHVEKNEGDCIGELKGEIFFTSTTSAVYRQGGDPCVLQLQFSASGVTLKEEQGCGNHRGIDCELNGTYPKKKAPKIKTPKKSTKR